MTNRYYDEFDTSFSFYGESGAYEPDPFYGDDIPGLDEF